MIINIIILIIMIMIIIVVILVIMINIIIIIIIIMIMIMIIMIIMMMMMMITINNTKSRRPGPEPTPHVSISTAHSDSLRGSSVEIGTIQRRLARPLRKDYTHKSRSASNIYRTLLFRIHHCKPTFAVSLPLVPFHHLENRFEATWRVSLSGLVESQTSLAACVPLSERNTTNDTNNDNNTW